MSIDPNIRKNNSGIDNLNKEYKHTLENMPWKQCKCNVVKLVELKAIFEEII